MSTDDKRFYRTLKRAVKKAGMKKARRTLKRDLADHPDEAHHDAVDFGGDASATMNGHDGRNRKAKGDG